MFRDLLKLDELLEEQYGHLDASEKPYNPPFFATFNRTVWSVYLTPGGSLIRCVKEANDGGILRPDSGRTSGASPELLCDYAEYTFPLEVWESLDKAKKGRFKRADKKHRVYLEALRDLVQEVPEVKAVHTFLNSGDIKLDPDVDPHDDRFIFWVGDAPKPLHITDEFVSFWSEYRYRIDGTFRSVCTLTGQESECVTKHDDGLGLSWISFNCKAHRSWQNTSKSKKARNASVSKEAHSAYVSALNFLMSQDHERGTYKHYISSEEFILSWRTVERDNQGPSLLPPPAGPQIKETALENLVTQARSGGLSSLPMNDECHYAFIVKNEKRPALVDYRVVPTREVFQHLLDWHENMRLWVTRKNEEASLVCPSIFALISNIVNRTKVKLSNNHDRKVYRELTRTLLFGESVPRQYASRMLERRFRELKVGPSVAGFLRFYLFQKGITMESSLDASRSHPGYQMGRFIFMAEMLQRIVSGEKGRGIAKSYLGGRADKTPYAALTEIRQKVESAYMPKMNGGWIVEAYEDSLRRIDLDALEETERLRFGAELTLGFAHQKHWYYATLSQRNEDSDD